MDITVGRSIVIVCAFAVWQFRLIFWWQMREKCECDVNDRQLCLFCNEQSTNLRKVLRNGSCARVKNWISQSISDAFGPVGHVDSTFCMLFVAHYYSISHAALFLVFYGQFRIFNFGNAPQTYSTVCIVCMYQVYRLNWKCRFNESIWMANICTHCY